MLCTNYVNECNTLGLCSNSISLTCSRPAALWLSLFIIVCFHRDFSFNNITGQVPQSLFSLSSLAYLWVKPDSIFRLVIKHFYSVRLYYCLCLYFSLFSVRFLGNNSLDGTLPEQKSTSLINMYYPFHLIWTNAN